jgi:chromosome segregation protein
MSIADSEMRVRFAHALDEVSTEFDRVFRVMLRGGEARLEQVDEEGGLEVRATLPGKRSRSSASFSGGERALVASALLFGVLRIRPAPFCVLDEVDAALDETNVDRYLQALGELSERTQMLVVTHNRATMAAARALYGLMMDSEGVSSLLSLRLDQYDAAVS